MIDQRSVEEQSDLLVYLAGAVKKAPSAALGCNYITGSVMFQINIAPSMDRQQYSDRLPAIITLKRMEGVRFLADNFRTVPLPNFYSATSGEGQASVN